MTKLVKHISVVIPTRNEPKIQVLIRSIQSVLKKLTETFEVIVIDKSDDDTPLRAKEEGAHVVNQQSMGLGGALKEGLQLAQGDIIFTMDADLSHDPTFIPSFIEQIENGYDLVVGSRKMKGGSVVGWGVKRKATSWGANIIGKYIAGVNVSDLTSGFRAYRANLLKTLDLEELGSGGYAFQLEILFESLKKGFKIGGVPIIFKDRTYGESKLRYRDIIEFFSISIRLLFKRLAG